MMSAASHGWDVSLSKTVLLTAMYAAPLAALARRHVPRRLWFRVCAGIGAVFTVVCGLFLQESLIAAFRSGSGIGWRRTLLVGLLDVALLYVAIGMVAVPLWKETPGAQRRIIFLGLGWGAIGIATSIEAILPVHFLWAASVAGLLGIGFAQPSPEPSLESTG